MFMHSYTFYTSLMRYYFLVLDLQAITQVHPYTPHLQVSHTALCMFIRCYVRLCVAIHQLCVSLITSLNILVYATSIRIYTSLYITYALIGTAGQVHHGAALERVLP